MSPDQRQREPSQEKKKPFGGKKNVSNPFGLKKDPKKSGLEPKPKRVASPKKKLHVQLNKD